MGGMPLSISKRVHSQKAIQGRIKREKKRRELLDKETKERFLGIMEKYFKGAILDEADREAIEILKSKGLMQTRLQFSLTGDEENPVGELVEIALLTDFGRSVYLENFVKRIRWEPGFWIAARRFFHRLLNAAF